MRDPLDAIRRLYGEPGEGLPAEGAELKAMADMKAALDRLPPRRPDPAVIDAVVAAAGETARPAVLDPIRAVYREEAAELARDAAKAEARALATMKTALDALPPQRPDASLIDAVVAAVGEAAQTAALAPVRRVYDEEPEPLASPAAEAEAAALAEMKAALDRLPPRRPDPAVINAVVAAARPASPPADRPATVAAVTGRAADRPVRRAGDTRRRVAAVLGTVFAVVLVFGGGLWLSQGGASLDEGAVNERAEADVQVADASPAAEEQTEEAPEPAPPSRTEAPAAPPADDGLLAAARSQPSAESPQQGAEVEAVARRVEPAVSADAFAAPAVVAQSEEGRSDDVRLAEAMALDADDELRLMYLRLREMQDGQAGLGWDTPPVALGAAPDSIPAASGWMQVRVQR